MHLVKINPEVFHLALHILVLNADLHHVRMFRARVLAHGFKYLDEQDHIAFARSAI